MADMTGRDMKKFVLAHRAEGREADQLVQRVTDGFYSNKYKAVDYDALRALAQQKKTEGQASLMKVKKLQDASKRTKEHNLINQHKAVWQKEFLRLNNLQRKLEADIAYTILQATRDETCASAFEGFQSYDEQLKKSRQQFKKETFDPIMELRTDLSYMVERRNCENPEAVLGEVDKVHEQQSKLLVRLHHEQQQLEQELAAGDLPSIDELHDFCNYSRLNMGTGIPEEVYSLACPDAEFKAAMMHEFLLIDARYVHKLEALDEEHQHMSWSLTGGWNPDDHLTFLYCTEQYNPSVTSKHRMLGIDMMRRHLPHRTRPEIIEHEEWWLLFQHYHRRTKALLIDWSRERTELMARTKNAFAEMVAAEEQRIAQQENARKQKEICAALYAKVEQWREERQEIMRLEEEIEQRRRQEQLDHLQREEEKEKAAREKQKQKIQHYQAVKTKAQEEKEKKDLLRLEELKKQHEEQAKVDRERVEYREEQLKQKILSQAEKERQKQLEEEEKEAVLEALREKVRPHVEGDLLRLWSDTKTWQAHTKDTEEFINIQKPLYEVNSFTVNQIAADSRVRLENELRSLGLQNHPHARHALANMPPPRQPRPDMQSTFKFE